MKCLLIIVLILSSMPVNAAPPQRTKNTRPHAEPKICTSLSDDYESASKELAMIQVEGIADDSAPRATMRETKSANILEKARLTMDLMKNNGCKLPTAAPSADRYFSAALACDTAVLKRQPAIIQAVTQGTTPPDLGPVPECDRKTWIAK